MRTISRDGFDGGAATHARPEFGRERSGESGRDLRAFGVRVPASSGQHLAAKGRLGGGDVRRAHHRSPFVSRLTLYVAAE